MPGSVLALADSWIVGTPLDVKETLGASDDLTITVFGASDSLPWPIDSDNRGRISIARRELSPAPLLCRRNPFRWMMQDRMHWHSSW
jgi:hypothetical protein